MPDRDSWAASPRYPVSAPAFAVEAPRPYRAVLPVFALLTRAAAHVGLMVFPVPHFAPWGHLQKQ